MESDEHLVKRTRAKADELTAHLDEGGDFSAENVLELIADVLVLGNRLEQRIEAGRN